MYPVIQYLIWMFPYCNHIVVQPSSETVTVPLQVVVPVCSAAVKAYVPGQRVKLAHPLALHDGVLPYSLVTTAVEPLMVTSVKS